MNQKKLAASTWEDVLSCAGTFKSPACDWVFRGQMNASWPLATSLERAAGQRFSIPSEHLPKIEQTLIRSFQRGSHNFIDKLPAYDDQLEWLALMQHHGAPTRLLDWTYSFYVALYFAVESVWPEATCAVWAVNLAELKKRAALRFSPKAIELCQTDPQIKRPETVQALFASEPLLYPLSPFRLNERLRIQQGLFLAPADITKSYSDNLEAIFDGADAGDHFQRISITLDLAELKRVLRELRRMNLTAETLFPGIDGFARSAIQKLVRREEELSLLDLSHPER